MNKELQEFRVRVDAGLYFTVYAEDESRVEGVIDTFWDELLNGFNIDTTPLPLYNTCVYMNDNPTITVE